MIFGLLAITVFFLLCGCWVWASLAEPEAFRNGAKFPYKEGGDE